MSKRFKNSLFIIFGIFVAIGFFYAGSEFGVALRDRDRIVLPEDKTELLDTDLTIFWEAVSVIKENYVDIKEVTDDKLLYGAVSGLLRSLGDPHSIFFNPADAKKFEEDLLGVFGGIGAEIGIRNEQLLIISPLKGNPAERVGLLAGDKILRVDEKNTANIAIDEAVKIIRGEPGTEVRLLIMRDGWNEAREFKITRELIIVPTLEWEILDTEKTKKEKIAFIQLYNFSPNSVSNFREAIFSVISQGAKGIILDLRNNSGGYLDTSIELAGWFLNRGEVVVKQQFRPQSEKEDKIFKARGNEALSEMPTVIIVNGGAASASEILAGALRDNRQIKLVGTKTFGKGTVQEVVQLGDGSVVKISVSKWVTPAGIVIDEEGLLPDFEIEIKEKDIEKEKDPQLEKAIEVMLNQITK